MGIPYMDNLEMGMDSNFKKNEGWSARVDFITPYTAQPHANHVPLKFEKEYD